MYLDLSNIYKELKFGKKVNINKSPNTLFLKSTFEIATFYHTGSLIPERQ